MSLRKAKRYCKFRNCETTDLDKLHMYRFPRDEKRCKLWLNAASNEKLIGMPAEKLYKTSSLCQLHFSEWCFANKVTKENLVHNAVPACLTRSEALKSLKGLDSVGKPSKDPNHPDFVPSLFVFTENADDLKKSFKKKQKKLLRSEADNLEETTSDEVTCVSSSCGKGFCATCFSPESVSSAFNMSLAPLNQTLTQLMGKLKEMEEEREQLRSELASCREEIQQMREAHQHCEVPSQSAGVNPIPNRFVSGHSSTSEDATEILESLYSGELSDADDPDLLPSLYLEQSYLQPSNKRQKKPSKATISDEVIGIMEQCPMPKKKRAKVSNPKPKDSGKSSKSEKSLNTGSPINIVYLKR